jgi:hypothetical protein
MAVREFSEPRSRPGKSARTRLWVRLKVSGKHALSERGSVTRSSFAKQNVLEGMEPCAFRMCCGSQSRAPARQLLIAPHDFRLLDSPISSVLQVWQHN